MASMYPSTVEALFKKLDVGLVFGYFLLIISTFLLSNGLVKPSSLD
jgi:hypothetical protein